MRQAILLSVLLSINAHAAPDRMHDYAYGVPITTDGEAPLYEIVVPTHVYQTAKRADLGDLRIFNAAGTVAPHALREAAPIIDTVTGQAPIFPLYTQTNTNGGDLHIRVDAGGAIVEVSSDDGANPQQQVHAYILDTSRESRGIEHLQLQWEGAPASFVTTVRVEASDDLDHWQTITRTATLARLQHGDYAIAEDRIEMDGEPARYLRINWPAGAQGVTLTDVTVHYAARQRERELQWLTLNGARDEKEAGTFEFDAGGTIPTQHLSVALPQRNDIQHVRISSRLNPDENWRHRYSGVVYALEIDGVQIRNRPISVGRNNDRYWQVQLDSTSTAAPRLRLAWRAHKLAFLARGQAPFVLAYGQSNVEPASRSLDALLKDLAVQSDFITAAVTGAPQSLRGTIALKEPFPWERGVLWTVLLAGVTVLVVMAWRLSRQLGGRPERPDRPDDNSDNGKP